MGKGWGVVWKGLGRLGREGKVGEGRERLGKVGEIWGKEG